MPETVIYRDINDQGIIEILQDDHCRSLHLGSDSKQSSVDLRAPQRLILSYTRAMMSCLLFRPAPRRVLLIGLGGGSLARFLLHHFPECLIDAVELRQDVARLAQAYFCLPAHPNLAIFISDAALFLRREQGRSARYDLILVDAFEHDGAAPVVKDHAFIDACAARLAPAGVFSINLWNNAADGVADSVANVAAHYGHNILELPVTDKGNLIVHAAEDKGTLSLDRTQQARTLEASTGIEFSALLRQLRRHNRWRALARFMGRD